jgi:hypothetical protein
LALPFVKKGEDRPLKAIETAERWIRGEATEAECAIAYAAAAAYASVAAAAAAYASVAAEAAYAAADAAYAYAAAAKRQEFRIKACDIFRKHIKVTDFKFS